MGSTSQIICVAEVRFIIKRVIQLTVAVALYMIVSFIMVTPVVRSICGVFSTQSGTQQHAEFANKFNTFARIGPRAGFDTDPWAVV